MPKETDFLKMVDGKPATMSELPAVINQIKADSLLILEARLKELFSSCDDLFFDLSSRASSNSEQNLYFESMRDVRVKKTGVINSFKQHFEQNFIDLGSSTPQRHNPTSSEDEQLDTLSLVQEDQLEEDVAISSMATKARNRSQEDLYHLVTRFDYLLPQAKINEDNNPLDPQQICRAFALACETLALHIKAQIIIYKQFERVVVSQLNKVYTSANELLINAGVLPKIRYGAKRNSDTSQNNHPQEGESPALPENFSGHTSQGMHFDFGELANLLAGMRKYGLAAVPSYTTYSANPGKVMPQSELINLLSDVQPADYQASISNNDLSLRLHDVISQLLASPDTGKAQALNQSDEDVINLVAMFFDFVLDDKDLPIPIQALISRLQIPVVKLALKDQSFFSNNDHPARQLINTIARSGIGWESADEAEKDRLFKKIASAIQTINEQYLEDDTVIITALNELSEYIDKETHKASIVEKRTSQASEGQAKTEHSRNKARHLLFEKLETAKLPENIHSFLCNQWLNYLILTLLKQGDDSQEWIEAEQLVDDLIWCCQPHSDAKSQERREKLVPNIISTIKTGLSKVAETAESSESEALQIQNTLQAMGQQDTSSDTSAKENVENVSLSASQAEALGHTPGSGSKSWKEMTALERQEVRYKALGFEYIQKADALLLGTWISYEKRDNGTQTRCKLATKIETNDTYIFVNRLGFKSLEISRKDLAFEMQQGRIKVLNSGPLFDRALASITTNLRQIGNQSSK